MMIEVRGPLSVVRVSWRDERLADRGPRTTNHDGY
jgi:hypothetical protein